MQLGTFTANIIVDGKALEEYDVVSESPTKMACWVASEEGKAFGVQWKCHEERRVTASLGRVLVDGISCARTYRFPGVLGMGDTCIVTEHVSKTATRDLMFARVQLSDDDSLLNKDIPKNLGHITLAIERGSIIKKKRRSGHRDHVPLGQAPPPGNNERFHERCKKATVHCVGFGPERARVTPRHKRDFIPDSQPQITFVFKYQPLAVLQANGIAPRPTPIHVSVGSENGRVKGCTGVSNSRDIVDIKPAQMNDTIEILINRVQGLEDELKRLRGLQASDSEDRKPKRVKTEEQRRPLFAPGEIIDLT